MRVPFDVLHAALRRVLETKGFTADRADLCASTFSLLLSSLLLFRFKESRVGLISPFLPLAALSPSSP